MHFYTYDEWVSNDYYSEDTATIYKGHTVIYDVTDNPNKQFLTIRSCWRDPEFRSTYPGIPIIHPELEKIDLDIGCLYKLTDDTSSSLSSRGCIQELNNEVGRSVHQAPYIQLTYKRYYYDAFEGVNKEVLTLNLDPNSKFDKVLIFQSVYSGAISFQEARSSLEFYFSDKYPAYPSYNFQKYDYRINTCIHSDDSLMVVGAMLTFDHVGGNDYILIESICEPVYGHVDMDNQYDWNLLWKTYKPNPDAEILRSSIMHQAKE